MDTRLEPENATEDTKPVPAGPAIVWAEPIVVQAAYAEIAPRAEHWIRGVQDAFCVPATI